MMRFQNVPRGCIRWLAAGLALAALDAPASAQTTTEGDAEPAGSGYTPQEPGPELETSGYIDIGFADAGGNGSSFHPADARLPADYGADAFAPAVNSRGDVASTDSGGRFTNGFLPRSLGIGGRPSFFLSTVSTDLRYSTADRRVMFFGRAQLLPRFERDAGNMTQVWVEQAFARVIPFDSQEFALTVGKFDSVFGIEYLDNQANLRTGITPSLVARYTTGTSIGAKAFYRFQVAPLWSAISINLAATNSGNMVEALQTPEISLTGRPVLSGRLGYELNLPRLQVKLGASLLSGPRNDQQNHEIRQSMLGFDGRLVVAGFVLAGEWVKVEEDQGNRNEKFTGNGAADFASGFAARGFWVGLSYRWDIGHAVLRAITPYVRLGQRRAEFESFVPITVRRITAGVRFDLGDNVALKAEWLANQEVVGAAPVDNDVKTASLVCFW